MFLLKKLIAVFLSLCFCLCLFAPVCFADNSVASDHTHNWVKQKIHSYSLEYNGIAFGIDVYKCSDCVLYLHKMLFLGYEVPIVRASPDTALGSEAAAMCAQALIAVFGKEWYATKFEAGGGSASPGGVGRNPAGYAGEGVPSVNSSGFLYINAQYAGFSFHSPYYEFNGATAIKEPYIVFNDVSGSGMETSCSSLKIYYKFTAPYSGIYFIPKGIVFNLGQFQYFYKQKWISKDLNYTTSFDYSSSVNLKKGDLIYYEYKFINTLVSEVPYRYSFAPSVVIACEPVADTVNINKQTNITINNNTWNGNIYTDNSTNLTYIYPQYTTINENNETVTNISNNPIIYNQETKQYYTYDQTTNNYYYITYGDPAPTPTPSPSTNPDGSTPDPGKPTPTPTPGGSGGGSSGGDGSGGGSGDTPSGDGSGGGSSDTPSGGGSSWWEKLLDKLGSALIDGLLDAIKGILKLLFDLFSSILGWIIWLCSKVFDLFPFLPPGVGALLVGGVVVCFILAFIKFIRG